MAKELHKLGDLQWQLEEGQGGWYEGGEEGATEEVVW